jgi:hypothetical protein
MPRHCFLVVSSIRRKIPSGFVVRGFFSNLLRENKSSMEQTPQPTPEGSKPADTDGSVQPSLPMVIVVGPHGDARPLQIVAPTAPSASAEPSVIDPAPTPIAPPAAAAVTAAAIPSAARPYRPIILPDDEPEQFDHGHGRPLVLLIRRGLAFFVDTVGVGLVFAIFGYHAMQTGHLPLPQDEQGMIDLFALSFGAALVLLFLFEAITGTSIGNLIFGLHVRRVGGQRAGVQRVFWRNIFRILDILLIGLILILVLRHRQRVGDKVSDTTVGRSPIGPFSTITGLLIVGALSWAIVEYGGGAATLQALQTQVKTYAPDAYQRTLTFIKEKTTASTPASTQPQASAAPAAQASAAPAAQASAAPAAQASAAPKPSTAPTAV